MRGARTWSRLLLRSPFARAPSGPISRTFFTSTPPSARSQLLSGTVSRGTISFFRSERSVLFRGWRSLRSKSDKPIPNATASEPTLSFSQRMRKLSREYGWAAFGVYMALTILDFPFCFLAVRSLGTERIGHYEHVVLEAFKNTFGLKKDMEGEASPAKEGVVQAAREGEIGWADDIEEAEAKNQGAAASIWTELALAYAIHKSFIFIRVPATAAITPKVVKKLRSWGYNIGKRTPKSS